MPWNKEPVFYLKKQFGDVSKKKIIKLLKNDGRGHHNAKWAARLEDFILKIVPRSEKPTFVAAMS